MPAVFVHGNPETAAVWSPLLAELEGAGADGPDLICLSPPGFGARLPTGFGATVGERTATLVERGMSEPVAEQVAKGQGEAMGQAALALYASAAQPVMAELGRTWRARRSGRDSCCSPPRIMWSEPSSNDAVPLTGPAPGSRPSMGSATDG